MESENAYIWFSMGIDHSNPYIHSTTVLCDYTHLQSCQGMMNARSETMTSLIGVGNIVSIMTCHPGQWDPASCKREKKLYTCSDTNTVRLNNPRRSKSLGTGLPSSAVATPWCCYGRLRRATVTYIYLFYHRC